MAELDLPDAQRVLRRAVQLDGSRPAAPSAGFGLDALEAAAADLGLGSPAVAMALAEARAGVPAAEERPKRLDRVIGPRRVVAVRHCRVPPAVADGLTAEWFERAHLLRVNRAPDGTVRARRRTDAAASAGRAVRAVRGGAGLGKVREIRSAVGATTDGVTAVCVHADVSDSRFAAVAAGSTVGTFALAGVGAASLLVSPLLVVGAPVAVVAGLVVARRSHRRKVAQIEVALEETIDAVSAGVPPPPALAGLGRGIRRLTGR